MRHAGMVLGQINCYFGPGAILRMENSSSSINSTVDLALKKRMAIALRNFLVAASVIFVLIYISAFVFSVADLGGTVFLLGPAIGCFFMSIVFGRFRDKLQKCELEIEVVVSPERNGVDVLVNKCIKGDCASLAIFEAAGNWMSHASSTHQVLVVKCICGNDQYVLPLYWSNSKTCLQEMADKTASITGLAIDNARLTPQRIDWMSFCAVPQSVR